MKKPKGKYCKTCTMCNEESTLAWCKLFKQDLMYEDINIGEDLRCPQCLEKYPKFLWSK